MKRTAIIIMLVTISSKLLGFTRDVILSFYYGASSISDAYFVSLTIPVVLFSFISASISTGFIPLYNKIEKEEGLSRANKFTSNVVNILVITGFCISFLGIIFAEPLVRLFARGFDESTFNLATTLTRISVFSLVLTGIVSIFVSFLQIKKSYIVASLIGFPLNLLTILFIVISGVTENSLWLAIGGIFAALAQFLFLLFFIYKSGYRHKYIFSFNDKYIKNMLYIAIPVILGVSVNQINILVDRTLASSIAVGGLSALSYADRINLIVQGIFVTSIVSIMYPKISKIAAYGDINKLKSILSTVITYICMLVIPSTLIFIYFAEPLVQLIFGRGAFSQQAIIMTSNVLQFYSIGLIGFGLREVLTRVFYSLHDSKTPMKNGIIGVSLNIMLSLILSRYLGVAGLALGTSISGLCTAGLMIISLKRKIGKFGSKEALLSVLIIIISSLLMCIITKLSYTYLGYVFNANVSLLLSLLIGGGAYVLVLLFTRIYKLNPKIV